MIDTSDTRLKPAMCYLDFKNLTCWMILQRDCRVSEVFPVCGILRLYLLAVEYYAGHLLGSWDWGEFRYLKLQTTVKHLISSEATKQADTYTRWVLLCSGNLSMLM